MWSFWRNFHHWLHWKFSFRKCCFSIAGNYVPSLNCFFCWPHRPSLDQLVAQKWLKMGICLLRLTDILLSNLMRSLFVPMARNSLRWRHNGNDSVSNHQPQDCLLNRLFRRRSKKTSKLRVTGICAGNSPGTGKFPAHMASNAESVSIWWRHHGWILCYSDVGTVRFTFKPGITENGRNPWTDWSKGQRYPWQCVYFLVNISWYISHKLI